MIDEKLLVVEKKITTSKKIIIISYIIGIILTILTVVFCFIDKDASTLGMLTGLAYAEISVSNAFYQAKAKKENTMKIVFDCLEKMPETIAKESTDVASLINSLNS